MPVPSRTMYAILGFLAQRPMSGYDIKRAVERSVDNFWSESFGQIYPILKRLAKDGMVRKTTPEAAGERARHVYTITEEGRAKLRQWLAEATAPPRVRNELLLKLFFGGQVDPETSRRQIASYRELLVGDLARYHAIRERLHRDYAEHPDLPYWLMTLHYGERDREAIISWCDEAFALLDQVGKRTQRRAGSAPRSIPKPARRSGRKPKAGG